MREALDLARKGRALASPNPLVGAVVVRDGEPVAAIVSMGDFARLNLPAPSGEDIARALRSAGAWKGLGGDDLAETIHRWRHESPERPPLRT